MKRAVVILTSALFLWAAAAGCATRRETGALAGAGLGAAAGGALTESPWGAAAGAVLGGIVGHEVGRAMDQYDREQAALALEHNRVGRPEVWTNPDTGYTYRVVPTDTYYADYYGPRTPCRNFTMYVDVGAGQAERVEGTACRRPDGTWEVIE